VVTRLIVLCLTLSLAACGSSSGAKTDMFGIIDTFIEPDGPKPWFRDGGCGPNGSGVSGGNCNPYAPRDAGAPTPDTMPADLLTPDICVPPATWDCQVSFSFDKQGSETTAGVHGDWDVFDGTSFVTRSATLNGNKWQLTVSQENGKTLTYKFVVDKGLPGVKWFHDPNNPNKVSDGFGGFNSQLAISCPDPCSR
jgi:hypothetical protein